MRFREARIILPDYHKYNDSIRYVELEKAKSAHRLGEAIAEKIGWAELPHKADHLHFEISVDAYPSDRFDQFLGKLTELLGEKTIRELIYDLDQVPDIFRTKTHPKED